MRQDAIAAAVPRLGAAYSARLEVRATWPTTARVYGHPHTEPWPELAEALKGDTDHALLWASSRDRPRTRLTSPRPDSCVYQRNSPRIATEVAFVEFLNALGTDSRWKVRRRPKASPTGGVLVGLEWTTGLGDISETMGFAPFASMPVPRRAPYVAIATWPGGRSNPFRGRGSTPAGRSGEVSFLDASHGFDEDQYEALWADTAAGVALLMSVPPDDPDSIAVQPS
jgi:hypothetical protein